MLALTVFVYSISSIQLTLGFNKSFILNTRLTLENENLVRELRIQKEAAEQANVAKSKFIATASYDLRQPVHALGLLAGALQGHAMNDDMRRLVGQIGGSVTAMDGLFDSLLDISRLDAGVVEAQIEDFPIQPVLERVVSRLPRRGRDQGPEAGLEPCSAIVAHRSVPVGAYPCEILFPMPFAIRIAAASSWAVVAGTGFASRCGIRAEASRWSNKAKVFREFFQLETPERDRAKGLGLGLAIVDRLAKLLDCPVALRSEPGRDLCSSSALRSLKDSFSARRASRARQCS